MTTNRRRRTRAFTLTELLIGTGISAIVLGLSLTLLLWPSRSWGEVVSKYYLDFYLRMVRERITHGIDGKYGLRSAFLSSIEIYGDGGSDEQPQGGHGRNGGGRGNRRGSGSRRRGGNGRGNQMGDKTLEFDVYERDVPRLTCHGGHHNQNQNGRHEGHCHCHRYRHGHFSSYETVRCWVDWTEDGDLVAGVGSPGGHCGHHQHQHQNQGRSSQQQHQHRHGCRHHSRYGGVGESILGPGVVADYFNVTKNGRVVHVDVRLKTTWGGRSFFREDHFDVYVQND